MCDFKPGDEVVCVEHVIWHTDGRSWDDILTLDAVYVVEGVGPSPSHRRDMRGKPAVFLVGVQNFCENAGCNIGFRPNRFRKVQKRDLTEWLASAAPADPILPAPPKPVRPRERETV